MGPAFQEEKTKSKFQKIFSTALHLARRCYELAEMTFVIFTTWAEEF